MSTLSKIEEYKDQNQNRIHCSSVYENAQVVFRGKNNTLRVHPGAKLAEMIINFDCDDGYCEIGSHDAVNIPFKSFIRIGLGSRVVIGKDVTCTSRCTISALEGASVIIEDDCMIASGNEIRSDDAHPIFDVETGKRINPAQSIQIGSHVWIAARAVVLGGTTIGQGSVVGHSCLVKGKIPNNSIVAGVPGRIIRRNIAWERPHLSLSKPWIKNDASSVTKSSFWDYTEEAKESIIPIESTPRLKLLPRLLRRLKR